MGFDWTLAYPYFETHKCLLLDKNGNIAGLSTDDGAEVYNLLAESLNSYFFLEGGSLLTPKAVYLAFKRHVSKVFPTFVPESSSDDLETPNDPNDSDLDSDYDSNIQFSTTLVVDVEADLLQPSPVVCGRRVKQRLSPGWTAKLTKIITKAVKATECIFTFKNHEFVAGELSTTAQCNECGSFVIVRGMNASTKLHLSLMRGLSTKHSKKRRIFGDERSALAKKAKYQSSLNIRNEFIEDEYGPDEALNCNVIPSLQKYLHEDVFEALDVFNASNDTRFRNCIRVCSRRPFMVVFWLPIQKELFDVFSKNIIYLSVLMPLVQSSVLH